MEMKQIDMMKIYNTYCTKEQSIRAVKLGAPIEAVAMSSGCGEVAHDTETLPTFEQMSNWIAKIAPEARPFVTCDTYANGDIYYKAFGGGCDDDMDYKKDEYELAIRSAVDMGLYYLEECGMRDYNTTNNGISW